MSKSSYSVTGTGDTYLCDLLPSQIMKNELGQYTFVAQGTFGGTTLTPKLSFDGGTTLLDIEDANGVAYTMTSNRRIQFLEANARKGEPPVQLWANCVGGSGIALSVFVLNGA